MKSIEVPTSRIQSVTRLDAEPPETPERPQACDLVDLSTAEGELFEVRLKEPIALEDAVLQELQEDQRLAKRESCADGHGIARIRFSALQGTEELQARFPSEETGGGTQGTTGTDETDRRGADPVGPEPRGGRTTPPAPTP